MTDADWLRDLLRTALPPTTATTPSRDLWPLVRRRFATSPAWSRTDYLLVGGVAVALLLYPGAWLALAHQL
ncbi:MAG: hypothetical protein ACRD1V_15315 [Vicinamibacterales bacterium]